MPVTAWILAGISLALGATLALRIRAAEDPAERHALSRAGAAALPLLPGAFLVYLSFNAGGFFIRPTAFVALALLLILAARAALSERPFAGLGRPFAIAAGALTLYALWTLLSAAWSAAPARALIEFNRALPYLAALVLFGSTPREPSRVRWMVRGLAVGIVAVCAIALVTRLLPDVWPIAPNIVNDRLSYPLTYWNALGVIAALGIVFCLHLASSRSEPRLVRALGSAAVPPLATALFLTFSRGAVAAGVIGILTYLFLARPRGLAGGLLATGPATAIAVVIAYQAEAVAGQDMTTPAAVEQGRDVALAVALCAAGAAGARWALFPIDERLARLRLPRHIRRRVLASAAAAFFAVGIGAIATGLPGYLERQFDRFVHSQTTAAATELRSRFTDPTSGVRLEGWRVAARGFTEARFKGQGAGTYELAWARARPSVAHNVRDAHSLYLEALNELGLVGFSLLVLALGTILAGLAARTRGPNRTVYAALFAAALAWAVHAGVDWDWEMPATGLWLFAVGGAALAARDGRRGRRTPSPRARTAAAVGALVLAVPPILLGTSQARIESSIAALRGGDCEEATAEARSATSALGLRAEPHEILGYCEAARGLHRTAVAALHGAVERDPENWETHYGLAIVQAAAGMDPRPATRTALRLNPKGFLPRDAVRRFAIPDPQAWKREAETAHLFVSPAGLLSRLAQLRTHREQALATPGGR